MAEDKQDTPSEDLTHKGLQRRIGQLQATATNMTQMCGVGPFITIPAMVATMGGPQAIFGWIIGAIVALADGLVWAELGAAMPGSGGSYVYLREAFQYRTGRLMPFLFTWTAVLFIPLIMATGVIGLVSYLGYLVPGLTDSAGDTTVLGHLVGIGVVLLAVLLLFRKIGDVGKITSVFFVVMLIAVFAVIAAAYTHFDPNLAFDYPQGTFQLGGAFWTGLGGGLVFALYDYLGYNTTAYLGAELRRPGRTLPRSIVTAVLGIMALYFLMQLGVLGVMPWQQITASDFIAAEVVQRTWGGTAATVITVLIVVTAFASVFAGLLGGSRVPFEAARDKLFLPWFGKLHPKHSFPHIGLLVIGAITAIGSLFPLTVVIDMLTTVLVIVQSVAQIVALVVLRRRQPDLHRPYRQWLYPVPALVALVGWIYAYFSAGVEQITLSLAWLVLGVGAFLIWARFERTWPFGPKEIREEYLEHQKAETDPNGGSEDARTPRTGSV